MLLVLLLVGVLCRVVLYSCVVVFLLSFACEYRFFYFDSFMSYVVCAVFLCTMCWFGFGRAPAFICAMCVSLRFLCVVGLGWWSVVMCVLVYLSFSWCGVWFGLCVSVLLLLRVSVLLSSV